MSGEEFECLYEDLEAKPEPLVRIETRPTVQTWIPGSPVIPGKVWCWNHGTWEKLT